MTTPHQRSCFKELVLAHHAYERALAEFAAAAQIRTGHVQRTLIKSICEEYDPRDVPVDAAASAISILKEW
jgi:hypothetical protein